MALKKIFIAGDGKVRSIWALLVFGAVVAVINLGLRVLLTLWGVPTLGQGELDDPRALVESVTRLASALIATVAGCAVVRQPFTAAHLAPRSAGRLLALGLALGAAVVSCSVGISALAGMERFSFSAVPPAEIALAGALELVVFVGVSASEELVLRGFFLQQLARGLGGVVRWFALRPAAADPARADALGVRIGAVAAVVISGSAFGIGHAGNPNASPVAVLNIALAGLWLGAVVMRTGSLWMVIGIHIAWNWFEGFVWGEPVSGIQVGTTLLVRTPQGSELWTGGGFGPEASAIMAVVMAVALLGTVLWPTPRRTGGSPAPGSPHT
jgi:membrane protease YdiL (CAAX protease family)